MINMSNVSFSYGEKKVLDNFNLSLKKGERACLFGESGSGKTTILRLICELEKAQSGQIIIGGKLSVVFQEDRLLPFKTVIENISAVNGDEKKCEELLKAFSLYEYKDKYPRSLSGGMKRRIAIIRALSRDFDILILDEAFNGIDRENIEKIAQIINENTKDKTLVMVSHSEWEAEILRAKIVKI